MSNLQLVCQAVKAVLKAAESSRGGSVGYTPYHVYMTLKYLEEDSLGRPRLQRLLGLSEAPVKTLLQRLEALGLSEKAVSGRGHKLTELGRGLLNYLEKTVRVYRVRVTPLGEAAAIVSPVPRPVKDLVDVYHVRDYLVAEGCRICIIGGIKGGNPEYPGLPEEEAERLRAWDPGITDGIVVLVPQECVGKAFSALLKLVAREYCG